MTSPEPAPRAPNPILVVLGRGLEGALNRALALDPDTVAALKPLDGRALGLSFEGSGLALRIGVDGERLRVGPAFAGARDLDIAATPGSLFGLAVARLRGDADATGPGRVRIAGDAELARRVERLATRFSPDLDEAFARVFGDVVGFQLARALRRGFAFAGDGAKGFARDTADWLVEERRDLVARAELDGFLDAVDGVREHADRLEARVRRLAGPART